MILAGPAARRRVRRPRLVLGAAVLVLAGLLPGTASAAAERGLLVVEGQGGRTGVLELPRRLTLADPRPLLTGGSGYAGLLLEPLEPGPGRARAVGAVVVRAFRDATSSSVGMIGFDGELAAGSYRVTLLGDGPVRVVYRLADRDDPGVTLVPRTPLRTRLFGRAEPLRAVPDSARVDLPGALPPGRRAIQVSLFAEDHVSRLRMCATTEPECSSTAPLPLPLTGSQGHPQIVAQLVAASSQERVLRWRTEGYRLESDRLRAAAIVF